MNDGGSSIIHLPYCTVSYWGTCTEQHWINETWASSDHITSHHITSHHRSIDTYVFLYRHQQQTHTASTPTPTATLRRKGRHGTTRHIRQSGSHIRYRKTAPSLSLTLSTPTTKRRRRSIVNSCPVVPSGVRIAPGGAYFCREGCDSILTCIQINCPFSSYYSTKNALT